MILEAAYEATILAAILNGDRKYFINLLGGAFFNKYQLILTFIENSLLKYKDYKLELYFNSYKHNILVNEFADNLKTKLNLQFWNYCKEYLN